MILFGTCCGYSNSEYDMHRFYIDLNRSHIDYKKQNKIIESFPHFAVHFNAKYLDKNILQANKNSILRYIELKLDLHFDGFEDSKFMERLMQFDKVLQFHNLMWYEFDEIYAIQFKLTNMWDSL